MKTKLILILAVLFLTFTSCSNNDDQVITNQESTNVPWSLRSVVGGLAGTNDTFEAGIVLWTFNEDTNTLVVVNNNTEVVIYDGLETGTYDYVISTIDNQDFLIVNIDVDVNYNLGRIEIIDNELIIDNDIPLDGLLLTFETYTQ